MKTLKIGVADYDRMKARTMAILRNPPTRHPRARFHVPTLIHPLI